MKKVFLSTKIKTAALLYCDPYIEGFINQNCQCFRAGTTGDRDDRPYNGGTLAASLPEGGKALNCQCFRAAPGVMFAYFLKARVRVTVFV